MTFVSNVGLAFQKSLEAHSNRTALLYPGSGEMITYAQLAELSKRIATSLLGLGVTSGSVVAMFHDKSPQAFAAILACLRLGVIYTVLDPDSPWVRLHKILGTCRPNIIVNGFSNCPYKSEIEEAGFGQPIQLQDLSDLSSVETLPDMRKIAGSAPAYIMFTSGSTGIPKGAVMSHANLLWFIQWSRERFAISPSDVLTNVNPVYFDNSVFDFYSAVFNGATLVPFTSDQVKDPRALVRLVNDAACTIWFSVPSLLVYLLTTRAFRPADLPNIRKIVFGGEGFPKGKLKQLYDTFGHRADLENVYGPTECTCICSAHTIGLRDFDDMQNLATLGALSQNFDFEILPLDATDPTFGELFLRGPQVGLGYYNDSTRTTGSFIQNPTHDLYTDIGYRTGDLVKLDDRGFLHFKGRADFQVKHMGYRIELEEIEAAFSTLNDVQECAVIYEKMAEGMGRIVAFVAAASSTSPADLVERVAAIVPAYMVPRQVRVLDMLPKNANGKIDRIALKALTEA